MCRFVHFSGGLQTLSTDMVENLPGNPMDQHSAWNKRRCPAPSGWQMLVATLGVTNHEPIRSNDDQTL
jgi:hypothetical protein